jgi:hypothetical protein
VANPARWALFNKPSPLVIADVRPVGVTTATPASTNSHTVDLSHRLEPMAPIELSLIQSFEVERLKREIDAQSDPAALRGLAKELLKAWFNEKASTNQAIKEQLGG